MANLSSAHRFARLSRLSSGSSPSSRFARASIGGCQAPGPNQTSLAAAQRISQPRAPSGPRRSESISSAARASESLSSQSTSRSRSTRSASSSRSRSSIGRVPGIRPASCGKAASSHCEKAWIVSMRRPPPGQSSTAANSVRARASVSGSPLAPMAIRSRARRVSSMRTQLASTSFTRVAISAAPALVKVRHRICSGRTPGVSSRRSTRAESTCVLPVPAEAESHTLSRGSTARAWLSFRGKTLPLTG